jgi:hypothetical protein
MTTIQAKVPDYLAKLTAETAEREHTTLDQIIALALSAQLGAWRALEDMATRAGRGKPQDLRDILATVPDVPPLPGDEL